MIKISESNGNLNYEVIDVNDILPNGRKIRKVTTGSELLFIYELDKYAKVLMGKKVSLKGVEIHRNIINSSMFSFVVENGLDVGFTPDYEMVRKNTYKPQNFITTTIDGIVLERNDEELVHYNFEFAPVENTKFHRDNRSAVYVSLVAYVVVSSLINDRKLPKIKFGTEAYSYMKKEYVDLLILERYGNKLLKGMIEVVFGESTKLQPEWEAFLTVNRQRGFMNRPYTKSEKHKHLVNTFEVGDVVFYYTRKSQNDSNDMPPLESFAPAVIREITGDKVTIEYYPAADTKLTRYYELEDAISSMEFNNDSDETIYSNEDFVKFHSSKVTFDLTNIGINLANYAETAFIIEPFDTDKKDEYLKTPTGVDKVTLGTLDAIYAIFEDRGVVYNKERYLSKYFKNRVPVWEEYQDRLANVETE